MHVRSRLLLHAVSFHTGKIRKAKNRFSNNSFRRCTSTHAWTTTYFRATEASFRSHHILHVALASQSGHVWTVEKETKEVDEQIHQIMKCRHSCNLYHLRSIPQKTRTLTPRPPDALRARASSHWHKVGIHSAMARLPTDQGAQVVRSAWKRSEVWRRQPLMLLSLPSVGLLNGLG